MAGRPLSPEDASALAQSLVFCYLNLALCQLSQSNPSKAISAAERVRRSSRRCCRLVALTQSRLLCRLLSSTPRIPSAIIDGAAVCWLSMMLQYGVQRRPWLARSLASRQLTSRCLHLCGIGCSREAPPGSSFITERCSDTRQAQRGRSHPTQAARGDTEAIRASVVA